MTIRVAVFGAVILVLGSSARASDWPVWRGPNRNGIAAEGQDPPVSWTATRNVNGDRFGRRVPAPRRPPSRRLSPPEAACLPPVAAFLLSLPWSL